MITNIKDEWKVEIDYSEYTPFQLKLLKFLGTFLENDELVANCDTLLDEHEMAADNNEIHDKDDNRSKSVKPCKHEYSTPYYGQEGDYWGKRCDDCGEELD